MKRENERIAELWAMGARVYVCRFCEEWWPGGERNNEGQVGREERRAS